jgi:polar amino acid transport system substrate-binding protein
MSLKALAAFALGAGVLLAPAAHAQDAIPKQSVNAELRAKLPKSVLDAGELVAVNSGVLPAL